MLSRTVAIIINMPRRMTTRRRLREEIMWREWKEMSQELEMQNPRFRTKIAVDLKPARFHLGSLDVTVKVAVGRRVHERTMTLPRVSLKESTIPNAGYGVHLRQDVVHGQLLLKYWGRKISMKEADRQRNEGLVAIEFSE